MFSSLVIAAVPRAALVSTAYAINSMTEPICAWHLACAETSKNPVAMKKQICFLECPWVLVIIIFLRGGVGVSYIKPAKSRELWLAFGTEKQLPIIWDFKDPSLTSRSLVWVLSWCL